MSCSVPLQGMAMSQQERFTPLWRVLLQLAVVLIALLQCGSGQLTPDGSLADGPLDDPLPLVNGVVPDSPSSAPSANDVSGTPPNILLVIADDLNRQIGHLGAEPAHPTPNLDKLAAEGVTFTNAHACAPDCKASRFCLLLG